MTDADRREADRLEAKVKALDACAATDLDDEGERMSFKIGFTRGYAAACEAKRTVLKAEREKAERLLEALECYKGIEGHRRVPTCYGEQIRHSFGNFADEALAKYRGEK